MSFIFNLKGEKKKKPTSSLIDFGATVLLDW